MQAAYVRAQMNPADIPAIALNQPGKQKGENDHHQRENGEAACCLRHGVPSFRPNMDT